MHWSFFSTSLPPLIEVSSGDFVTIETVTHHANDDRDRTVVGDRGSPARDAAEYVLHGFSYPSYLAELGSKAQSDFYGKSSVDLALRDAFRKLRHFLMTTQGLSEDEAISLISVAADFVITQVVDGNWGVQGGIDKSLFVGDG